MEVIGSGEFSGTSMIAMPAASSTAAIAVTSSGCTPRRMAISGQRVRNEVSDIG